MSGRGLEAEGGEDGEDGGERLHGCGNGSCGVRRKVESMGGNVGLYGR